MQGAIHLVRVQQPVKHHGRNCSGRPKIPREHRVDADRRHLHLAVGAVVHELGDRLGELGRSGRRAHVGVQLLLVRAFQLPPGEERVIRDDLHERFERLRNRVRAAEIRLESCTQPRRDGFAGCLLLRSPLPLVILDHPFGHYFQQHANLGRHRNGQRHVTHLAQQPRLVALVERHVFVVLIVIVAVHEGVQR